MFIKLISKFYTFPESSQSYLCDSLGQMLQGTGQH